MGTGRCNRVAEVPGGEADDSDYTGLTYPAPRRGAPAVVSPCPL